jgi:6,7-dimethyl-8-ribityllumazine synthase
MSRKEVGGDLRADGLKLCVVISRFNDFLTKQLLDGAVDSFLRHGGKNDNLTVVWVPGANEVPMGVQKGLQTGKYDAVVALAAVIEGATKHADLINSQVSRALGSIALAAGVPVINGVVAADNLEQAIERCGTKAGNKGWSAVQAAIEMANVYRQLDK